MRKIFQTCENQIFEDEVEEKIYSLKFGALSKFLSYDIYRCWRKVLEKPLYERVISRFKYDRFNYYAVRAYREYFLDDRVSTIDIFMLENENYSDESISKLFLNDPMFRSFYEESVFLFQDTFDDLDADSKFGSRANESRTVSNQDADSASLGEIIWDLSHCRAKTDEQDDEQTTEQTETNETDEETDEQKDIEELAKKLGEFIRLYNTAFDKFKRLKG